MKYLCSIFHRKTFGDQLFNPCYSMDKLIYSIAFTVHGETFGHASLEDWTKGVCSR